MLHKYSVEVYWRNFSKLIMLFGPEQWDLTWEAEQLCPFIWIHGASEKCFTQTRQSSNQNGGGGGKEGEKKERGREGGGGGERVAKEVAYSWFEVEGTMLGTAKSIWPFYRRTMNCKDSLGLNFHFKIWKVNSFSRLNCFLSQSQFATASSKTSLSLAPPGGPSAFKPQARLKAKILQQLHSQSWVWHTQWTGKIFLETDQKTYPSRIRPLSLSLSLSLPLFLLPSPLPFRHKTWLQFISKLTTELKAQMTPLDSSPWESSASWAGMNS